MTNINTYGYKMQGLEAAAFATNYINTTEPDGRCIDIYYDRQTGNVRAFCGNFYLFYAVARDGRRKPNEIRIPRFISKPLTAQELATRIADTVWEADWHDANPNGTLCDLLDAMLA